MLAASLAFTTSLSLAAAPQRCPIRTHKPHCRIRIRDCDRRNFWNADRLGALSQRTETRGQPSLARPTGTPWPNAFGKREGEESLPQQGQGQPTRAQPRACAPFAGRHAPAPMSQKLPPSRRRRAGSLSPMLTAGSTK